MSGDHSDYVPWVRVGPDRSRHWDWTRPALRARVRPGTVLETYDCGYITVHRVEAEGVVQSPAPVVLGCEGLEELLWTWEELKRYECTIKEP